MTIALGSKSSKFLERQINCKSNSGEKKCIVGNIESQHDIYKQFCNVFRSDTSRSRFTFYFEFYQVIVKLVSTSYHEIHT